MSIKVLHLIDSGGLYGAEKMLLALVAAQVEEGLRPTILSAGSPEVQEKPLEREAKDLGLPVKVWRMVPGLNFREALNIIKWAKREGFDVLHSHGYKFNILIGLLPRRLRKLPFVTTVHGYVHAAPFTKMWAYEWLDRKALGRVDHVVLVGEGTRRELPAPLVDSSKITVIHNGLAVERLYAAADRRLDGPIGAFMEECSPLIVAVGRLSREKGFDHLIQAFPLLLRKNPRAGLLIIGEGRLRAELESFAAQLNVADNILMAGYCSEVPAVLKRADVLVMPSLTEGLPITLLETMTLKTPVIASAVGEIPVVLGYGKGGVLLNDLVPKTIAEAIEKVLSEREELTKKLNWASEAVKQKYTNRKMEAGYRDLYRRVVE